MANDKPNLIDSFSSGLAWINRLLAIAIWLHHYNIAQARPTDALYCANIH